MLHVDKIFRQVGNGCTDPLFCEIDGTMAILKTYNNPETNRVLINELICYQIAKKLNLTIPESGICLIDNDTQVIENIDFDETKYGISFFSTRLDHATLINTPQLISKFVNNKDIIPKIILFDHLIYNKDRAKGNLLIRSVSKNNRLIYIIDHTHVFNLEAIWDAAQLRQCISRKDYEDTDIMESNSYLYNMFFESISITLDILLSVASEFQSNLSETFYDDILREIPYEWGASSEEIAELKNYLIYRLANLETMCYKIYEYRCRR